MSFRFSIAGRRPAVGRASAICVTLATAGLLAVTGCLPEDAEEPNIGRESHLLYSVVGGGTAANPLPARMVIPDSDVPQLDGDLGTLAAPGGPPVIIYMNRLGGTYTPGNNDASTNRSSIPNQTSVIQPWNVSDAGWNETMAHMREIFAPFNVTITDVDPGATPHYESVMAGYPQNVGMNEGTLGVSPYTLSCSLIPNSIVYTFADYTVDVLGPNYRVVAEIAAQEVAHSFGLDHQLLASDPMTYLNFNGQRTFKNAAANCGESGSRPCGLQASSPCTNLGVPGSTTQQNSYMALMERVGGVQLAPPAISIDTPQNGDLVAAGFDIGTTTLPAGTATITQVELYIDGALTETRTAPPFTFTAPGDLSPGAHQILTRATDSNGLTSDVSISVTVEANSDPTDPGDGDPSDPGDPTDPGNPGDPGDPGSGDPGSTADPSGGTNTQLVGGCQAGGNSGATGGLAVLLLGCALALGRRRRRRR